MKRMNWQKLTLKINKNYSNLLEENELGITNGFLGDEMICMELW